MALVTAELLADAFSASLNANVYTYEAYLAEKEKRGGELYSEKLDLLKLFELSYLSGPFGDVTSSSGASKVPVTGLAGSDEAGAESFCIKVKNIIGDVHKVHLHGSLSQLTVQDLKREIEAQKQIPFMHQRLIFGAQPLEDGNTLASYELHDDAVVFLVIRKDTSGVQSEVFHIDPNLLDPSWDYDFTNMRDNGTRYVRGGHVYHRPYGWRRISLKVLGAYGDDVWLGSSGNARGEWPVSFHSTARTAAGNIANVGYERSKKRGFAFTTGVFSTPFVEEAAKYAPTFTHKGKRYQMVLQNRVSPDGLQIVTERNRGDSEYWMQPNNELIRAYCICIREVQ